MKFTLLACVLSLLFAGAAVAQGVEGHIVGANSVNCRSCARRSCQPQRVYKRGDLVGITCITNANTEILDGDGWWDKTTDGCYVSDAFIDYTNGSPKPICS